MSAARTMLDNARRLVESDAAKLLLIAAVTVASYAPAFSAGFVFDDHDLVEHSFFLNGPLRDLWITGTTPDYWPVTWTTLWVESRLWGADALGYHVTNVLLHAAAAFLLYRVLKSLQVRGAWFAGLLFAVHPVAVESVAWISERKNPLSFVLLLGSVLGWIAFEHRREARYWIASLVLFLLALLAKAATVMLPVLLLGAILFQRRRVLRRDVLHLAPYFGLSLVFGAVTCWFQWTGSMDHLAAPRSALERASGAAWALGSYLQKAFIPVRLAFVYPRWPVDSWSFHAATPVVLVAAALLWRFRSRVGWPVVLGVAYHFVVVLPALGLLEMAYFRVGPVSNHLQYLALAGPAAVVAVSLAQLAASRPRIATAIGAALIAVLASRTFTRATAFHDDLSLWREASEDAPGNLTAARMYRRALLEAMPGDASRAEGLRALARAAEHAPSEAERRRALAWTLYASGAPADALREALTADALHPDPPFMRELGERLVHDGFPLAAIDVLAPIVRDAPRSVEARYWLGAALTQTGRREEAIELLREGCRLVPGNRNLSDALSLLLSTSTTTH